MGFLRGKSVKNAPTPARPELVRRRANQKSTLRSGRTIAERREHVETASERMAARDKVHHQKQRRLVLTVIGFIICIATAVFAGAWLFRGKEQITEYTTTVYNPYTPTIEVVDEDAGLTSGKITSRMKEYIGMAEADFRELGYTPVKVVIPSGAIREVDFYLDGISGRIKLTIDRGSGISVEDADRMLRYLAGQGITEFEYIDVRIDGKAYWK